jgi:hypothetical protein
MRGKTYSGIRADWIQAKTAELIADARTTNDEERYMMANELAKDLWPDWAHSCVHCGRPSEEGHLALTRKCLFGPGVFTARYDRF